MNRKFIGGGMDHYNGSLFFWIGDFFHVLAGIPDKDSSYVKIGKTEVFHGKDWTKVVKT